MYEQVKKIKKNKRKTYTNVAAQKKNNRKQRFIFGENQPLQKITTIKNIIQREIIEDDSYARWKLENYNPLSYAKLTDKADEIDQDETYKLQVKQESRDSKSLAVFDVQKPDGADEENDRS